MTQTFIDMLVAIKDPVAIERAYNILAAKREMLLVDAKQKFQHSVMEPKPLVSLPFSTALKAGDCVEVKGANRVMQMSGFYNGQQFKVIRRHKGKPEQYVIVRSRDTGNLASIRVDYLKRIHPVPTF